MTRINCIPPKELSDIHLQAELREMPRINSYIIKSLKSGKSFDIPSNYTLGTGHVKFFYNKLKYITNRYTQLQEEYFARFGKVYGKYYLMVLDTSIIPDCWFNDWNPTERDQEINRQRIHDRMYSNKRSHYTTLRRI